MQIRMLTTAAGPQGVWPAGTIVEVDPLVGADLISGGYAAPWGLLEVIETIVVPAVVETASLAPPENTALPRATRRGK